MDKDEIYKGAWEWNVLKSETPVLCGCVQESQAEVSRLQKQKEDLCAQIRDLSLPVDLASESLPALKKQLRLLESQVNEKAEEIAKLTAKIQQQQQVIQHTQNILLSLLLLPSPLSLSVSFRSTCGLR